MANISGISMEELSASLETMDWKLCFTCQQTGKDELQDPMTKKGKFRCCINKYLGNALTVLFRREV